MDRLSERRPSRSVAQRGAERISWGRMRHRLKIQRFRVIQLYLYANEQGRCRRRSWHEVSSELSCLCPGYFGERTGPYISDIKMLMVVQRWEEWQYRTINNICVRRIMECNNKRKRNYKLTKMPYPLWWRGPVYVLERPNPRTWGKRRW